MSDVPYMSFYDCNDGVYAAGFEGNVLFLSDAVPCFNNVAKPVLLSIAMDANQLQIILDNRHLFDSAFVSAALLLADKYNDLNVNIVD